nr:MAG TPA: hypothetical protein [Caudoviricetes sp.]
MAVCSSDRHFTSAGLLIVSKIKSVSVLYHTGIIRVLYR